MAPTTDTTIPGMGLLTPVCTGIRSMTAGGGAATTQAIMVTQGTMRTRATGGISLLATGRPGATIRLIRTTAGIIAATMVGIMADTAATTTRAFM